MNRMTLLSVRLLLTTTILLGAVSCGDSPSASSTTGAPKLDPVSVAQEITQGVGLVKQTRATGSQGPIFVFEEVHTSRVGQLQIAVMLLRLHDHHNVKTIGLEGSIWSGQPLQAKWSQEVDKVQVLDAKQDVAVRMVADGEMSSSELMATMFPDTKVYGVEDAGQYQQSLDVKGSPEMEYLLAVAEHSLSEADAHKVVQLMKANKKTQALDYMLAADPWVKQQYDGIKDSGNISSEQLIANLQTIRAKANAVGAQVRPQASQDLDNELHFLQTASERSGTMVDNVLRIPGASGQPAALIVGAAHADKVVELLTQKNVAFALIQPIDLNSKYGSMSVAEYQRKDKGEWARNSPGTLGHVLNSRHKPPPVIEHPSSRSYASMNLAGILMARSARTGGPSFPDDVLSQISALPGVRIDKNSISRDGNDVIFHAFLTQDDGTEKSVWARVGTRTRGIREEQPQNLEGKLIEKAEEFKEAEGGGGGRDGNGGRNGGRHGAGDPPDGGGEHDSVLPGDMKKGKETISRIARDTLVTFGSSREEVMGVGHISD